MKKILFVCVENSCRSQMAEAFGRIHGGVEFDIYSAGSSPSGQVNPLAVSSMKETGYDLSKHISKSLNQIPRITYDVVVTMGCGDECPNVKANEKTDWQIPDPKHLPPEGFRETRNFIELKVKELLRCLK